MRYRKQRKQRKTYLEWLAWRLWRRTYHLRQVALMALIVAPVLMALQSVGIVKAQAGLPYPLKTTGRYVDITCMTPNDAELEALALEALGGLRSRGEITRHFGPYGATVFFYNRLTGVRTYWHFYAPDNRWIKSVNLFYGYSTPYPTSSRPPYHSINSRTPCEGEAGRSLEVPSDGSFQSGIGFISGWVCEGSRVELLIDDTSRLSVATGISRDDTEAFCGDTRNGFITQFNWNLIGEGQHTVSLIVDGEPLQTNTFTVTTLGEEFVRGASGECTITDFPSTGETATFRWQEPVQGLVLTETE